MKKLLFICLFFIVGNVFSQNKNETLKIYLDCQNCDSDYYKQEVDYVEFVRDRKFADVHIFFTTQNNATNGNKYSIEFTGKNKYNAIIDKLEFSTTGETTTEQRRSLILKNLQFGLMRYWIANGLKDKLSLKVKKNKKQDKKEKIDPWNKWIFRLSGRGYFNGQESSSSRYLNGSFDVKQVKDKNKFSLRVGIDNSKSIYKYENEEIVSERKSSYLYLSDVYSVSNHLSVALISSAGNSLFSNKAFYYKIKPGVEYNFFDYKESEKRAVYVAYTAGAVFNRYYDKTIFNETEEFLWQHDLSLGALLIQKWGDISGEVKYRSYLHDSSLNGFGINMNANIKVFKGFSIDFWGDYGLSHDQINIRAGGTSKEELLLQQKQVKSGYNYYGGVGISYTFGSIYNTIVNPRFEL